MAKAKRLEVERARRQSSAELLQRALIALRVVRMAIDKCDLAGAKQACAELGEALELVEQRTGVVTPTSLFDAV